MLSVLLTIVSAVVTHISVRNARGKWRIILLCIALFLLGSAFSLATVPGGFWSGAYTLASVYFVACLITPWIGLLWRSRVAA